MTQKKLAILFLAVGASACSPVAPTYTDADTEGCAQCLPGDIVMDTEFREFTQVSPSSPTTRSRMTTVRAKLREIGGHCVDGEIRDRQGRRVSFYRMFEAGPAGDYSREFKKEADEIQQLEASGAVVIKMYAKEPPP